VLAQQESSSPGGGGQSTPSKPDKKQRQQARDSLAAKETVKLNAAQLSELEAMHRGHAEELEQLQQYQERQRDNLRRSQAEASGRLAAKNASDRSALDKYGAMEAGNFAAARDTALTTAQTRMNELIATREASMVANSAPLAVAAAEAARPGHGPPLPVELASP
jgi:hypothetical protein